jgi:hypothetical protein
MNGRQGDRETRRPGDWETRGQEDKGTRRPRRGGRVMNDEVASNSAAGDSGGREVGSREAECQRYSSSLESGPVPFSGPRPPPR